MDVIFLAAEDMLDSENPAEGLPILSCGPIHQEARAQLYAFICGTFTDEALAMEALLDVESALVYQLSPALVARLSLEDEDSIEQYLSHWMTTTEVEALAEEPSDLTDFVLSLVHLCQVAENDPDLDVYVMSDG